MKKLHYTITIDAPRKKVWEVMLDDVTYREWTVPFHEGSYYEGSWEEGSTIKFLALHEGKLGGMFSRIAKNVPYEFISIEHLGIIQDGKVDTASEEAKKWAPAFENYTFKDVDGGTQLDVELDAEEGEYADMFDAMWPKALAKLKEIAEK